MVSYIIASISKHGEFILHQVLHQQMQYCLIWILEDLRRYYECLWTLLLCLWPLVKHRFNNIIYIYMYININYQIQFSIIFLVLKPCQSPLKSQLQDCNFPVEATNWAVKEVRCFTATWKSTIKLISDQLADSNWKIFGSLSFWIRLYQLYLWVTTELQDHV